MSIKAITPGDCTVVRRQPAPLTAGCVEVVTEYYSPKGEEVGFIVTYGGVYNDNDGLPVGKRFCAYRGKRSILYTGAFDRARAALFDDYHKAAAVAGGVA